METKAHWKFVAAEHRNQHAERVRSPILCVRRAIEEKPDVANVD